jgi:hypothetical protein
VTVPVKIPLLVNAPYHMIKGNMEKLVRLGVGVEVFFVTISSMMLIHAR